MGIVLIIRKVLKNKNGKGPDGGSDGDDGVGPDEDNGGEPNGEPNNSPTEADSDSDGELDNSTEELDKSEGKETQNGDASAEEDDK